MLAPDPTRTRKPPPAKRPLATAAAGSPSPGVDLTPLLQAITAKPDSSGLLKSAHAAALQDTGAIVSGLRAQQQQINDQAAQRARDIEQASLGAAKYLSGLNIGHGLSDSLKQAAGDQASLAQGFSGQLQQTVGDAGAKIQTALGALGAPGGVPSTAAQAGNTVYGVGGLLPASSLLAAAPYAEAQANRAPANLIGQGQQEAVGALGAGRAQAAQLDPQIAAAAAKLPTVERAYFTQLQTAAAKSRQDAIGNVYKALALQQKGDQAAATTAYRQAQLEATQADRAARLADKVAARAQQRSEFDVTAGQRKTHDQAVIDNYNQLFGERVSHDTATEQTAARNADISATNAATSRQNAATSRLNAGSSRISALASQKRANAASTVKPSASLSRATGVLTGSDGNPITDAAGKPRVLPGFRVDPGGQVVKVGVGSKNGVSATTYSGLKKQALKAADLFYYGKQPNASGSGGIPGIDYLQALRELMHGYSLTRADAVAILNDFYAPGERGRPAGPSKPWLKLPSILTPAG